MTFSELEKEVLALGFEDRIDRSEELVIAASRALRLIYNERPSVRTTLIYHKRALPTLQREKIDRAGGEELILPLDGRAYSFRVSGRGSFTVRDGSGERREDFDGELCLFRGFTDGHGEIRFSGEYGYSILGFSVYADTVSPSPEDIPEFGFIDEVDMRKRCPDFLAFADGARDIRGALIPDIVMSDGRLLIPRDISGVISVAYKRSPRPICSDFPDEAIDIPEETAPLLPLLVAAYLWLDDAPDKAQYYMSLYRDGLGAVRRFNAMFPGGKYEDVTGWA